jgi:hypothetical protein
VGNRLPGGYVGDSRQLGRKTHRQNQTAPTVFVSLRLTKTKPPSGRLPTLHLPTHLGVQFKLVWFYYTQRRAGRPRSSPSPLRGNCRLSPTLVVWYIDTFSAPLSASTPTQPPGGRLPTLIASTQPPGGRLSTLIVLVFMDCSGCRDCA